MNFLNQIGNTFRRQGALTQIIILNAAVFLTINVVNALAHSNTRGPGLDIWLALPLNGEAFHYRFWTLFTYMFTHLGLLHVFWNMVILYLFAQVFFTFFTEKKFIYVYAMSGICGGALLLILALVFPQMFGNSLLYGASAAVTGVGATMLVFSPRYIVFPFGVAMQYKFYFLIIFAITTLIDLSDNTGGKIAHMGGALFGLVYGYNLRHGLDFSSIRFFKRRKKSHLRVIKNSETAFSPAENTVNNDEQRMNTLLEKISRSGYESLSKKEKDELFKLSQKK